jgi:CarD family transcriptional regulator
LIYYLLNDIFKLIKKLSPPILNGNNLHIYKKVIMQEKEEHSANKSVEEPAPNFEIGDLAVYPAHGVGRIKAIESREVDGGTQSFYIMKILENDMVIMIPVQNVSSVGLRTILSVNDIPKIYSIMQERDLPQDNQTWNRRYREYMEKIKTGSLYEVAGVYRDLFLLRLTKELSFGERKLFDTAQCLLVKELSIAKHCEEKTILNEINELFEPISSDDNSETKPLTSEDKLKSSEAEANESGRTTSSESKKQSGSQATG